MTHPGTNLLMQIGTQLGQGEIKQRPNDGEVEWRGTVYELRTRLKLDTFMSLEATIKFNNHHGRVDLNWDPEYVNEPAEDAFDGDDEIRVFVGKGVCIETFAMEMDEQMAGFRTLPSEQMTHLIGAMPRDGVSRVYIRSDELEFGMKEHLNEMPDGMGAAVRFTQMAGWCCANWQHVAADAQAQSIYQAVESSGSVQGVQGAPIRIKCEYCRTLFLLGTDPRCPNCGAPAQG